MTEHDPGRIWSALQNDPDFPHSRSLYTIDLYRELASALPTILAEELQASIDFMNLIKMRHKVLEHAIRSGFLHRLVTRAMQDLPRSTHAENIQATLEKTFELMAHDHALIIDKLQHFFDHSQSAPHNEDNILFYEAVGLTRENAKRMREGKLTTLDLIESQPLLLLYPLIPDRPL